MGCLTPRLLEHVRSLRATPVAAPRNLSRLPKHHTVEVAGDVDDVAADVSQRLTGWRRVTRRDGDVVEISAEKGYLREFGNIVFHFSLLGLLVAVAVGKLFGYEGNVIVIANGGPGFLLGVACRVRLVPGGQHRRRHVAAPDLPAGQRLRRTLPAERSGAELRRQRRLPGGRRPEHRHLAALPARGQPSVAARR